MAANAVTSEHLSDQKFPLTGKFTGNLAVESGKTWHRTDLLIADARAGFRTKFLARAVESKSDVGFSETKGSSRSACFVAEPDGSPRCLFRDT